MMALAESNAGNDRRAVELLKGVIKETPGFLEAHVRLVSLNTRMQRLEEAKRKKDIAVRLRQDAINAK